MRAPFFVPLGLAMAASTVIIAPAHALWFQALSANETVSTGTFPPVALSTSLPFTSTPEPAPTSDASAWPCSESTLADLHIDVHPPDPDGNDATIEVKNAGDASAPNIIIGFSIRQGWRSLAAVDFSNTQHWVIDGEAAATLYRMGDVPADASVAIGLRVTLRNAQSEADSEPPIIEAALASLACPDAKGDSTLITFPHAGTEATSSPFPGTVAPPSGSVTPGTTAAGGRTAR